MKEFARELKAPTALEQAQLDKDAAAAALRRKQMIELATLEMAQKKFKQDNCSHTKENGRTLFQGQIHSDGLYHPLCMRCGKEATPVEPPRELLAQGLA